ncbi:hypothetical protein AAC387_Pa03g2501 [Persea americana]
MEGKGRAIGIDLGTTYSCVGVWLTRHQRIEITTNDQGYSCVAFTKTELLIGEAAKKQAGKNPANTIFDVKRFIGRRFDDASVQKDIKHWPFKVVSDAGNKPCDHC